MEDLLGWDRVCLICTGLIRKFTLETRGNLPVEKVLREAPYTTYTTQGLQADGREQEAEQNELRPPSVEEFKRQFRQPRFDANKYQAEYEKNRKQAIKEILKENVKLNTKINDDKLFRSFTKGVEGG